MELTPKQDAFVRAYLETGNSSQAYRRAYDISPSTKPGTVDKRAFELMRHPKVARRLSEEQAKIAKRHELTIDRIAAEFATIAFADPGQFFEWGPDGVKVKPKESLTPEQRRAIGELSQTVTEAGGTIRVKLHDKLAALQALGKHLGFFREDAAAAASEAAAGVSRAALAVTAQSIRALVDQGADRDHDRDRSIEAEVERRVAARLRGQEAPTPRLSPPVVEHEALPPPEDHREPAPARHRSAREEDPHQPRVLSASEYFELEDRSRRNSRTDNDYDEFGQ